MDRKKAISLAIILAAVSAVACSRKPGGLSPFRAGEFHLEGELPPGWKMDSNTKDQALLLFPEFIELECPSVTFSRIARPVDAGAALEWHAVESRPIPGRENKVGSLRKMSIAGVDAWSYEESAIRFPERLHLAPGQAHPRSVSVRSVVYLTTIAGAGVEIEVSAPAAIFDKHKAEFDRIIVSLKPVR